jgi:hypothetical protein
VSLHICVHTSLYGRQWQDGKISNECELASGGFPWTVIPVQERDPYMAALESASGGVDI